MERRKKSQNGSSQKACLFKIDNELLGWLDKQKNKGRYINELIRRDMQASDGDGYAAAVEAETRRQNVSEEIDTIAVMQEFQRSQRRNPDTVQLWKHKDADRYDALFLHDVKAVLAVVKTARIMVAEAEGMKLEGCVMTYIKAADIELLKAAGVAVAVKEYTYQPKE